MDDVIHSDPLKSRVRLKLVPRAPAPHGYDGLAPIGAQSDVRVPRSLVVAAVRFAQSDATVGAGGTTDEGRLISSRDAAISRSLQEQTQLVLATLTPREQLVLRVRFGIGQAGDQPSEKIDEVLTSSEIAFIEAAALRKLRHPSQSGRLRSVDRR